ncbi:MAG: hypothetical protein LBD38_02750 [Streptococcaceae bacterium]|jgi:hypothetical protein|nr:hypothetical protein [Streptococcaceae bacterium]
MNGNLKRFCTTLIPLLIVWYIQFVQLYDRETIETFFKVASLRFSFYNSNLFGFVILPLCIAGGFAFGHQKNSQAIFRRKNIAQAQLMNEISILLSETAIYLLYAIICMIAPLKLLLTYGEFQPIVITLYSLFTFYAFVLLAHGSISFLDAFLKNRWITMFIMFAFLNSYAISGRIFARADFFANVT